MKIKQIGEGLYLIPECPGCGSDHLFHTMKPNRNGAKWMFNGNVNHPTFTPSYHAVGSCHFYVTDGRIQFLPDCDHALAGQTVELPEI